MYKGIKICRVDKNFKVGLLAIFFFFSSFFPAFCQLGDFAFRHITVSDGLSQSSVISIAQDQKGLMWFGSRDGLNKYDGNKFTIYKHSREDSSGISSNDILKVVFDSAGDLWIGTTNGLSKYDYQKDKFLNFLNDAEDNTTISDNAVMAICEANNGDIWIGTTNGLNRFNMVSGKFERFYHDPEDVHSISDNFVQDIYEDKDGFIWLATAGGLNKLDVSSKGKIRFTRVLHESQNSEGLSDHNAQSIVEDAEGNLWIGTKNSGLRKYDKSSGKFTSFVHDPENSNSVSHNDVRSLAFDKKGRLWIGTYNGLNLFDVENKRFQRMFYDKDNSASLSHNSVKSIFVDRAGTVWAGTYYGGVNVLDEQNNNFKNYRNQSGLSGLNFAVVSAFAEDEEGKVYIGTEGGGINVLDPRTGEFTGFLKKETNNSISGNSIKSLYLDDQHHLWTGSYNAGLSILDLCSGEVKSYRNEKNNYTSWGNDNVYSIVQENDSLYWLGLYGGGLNLFNKNDEQFLRAPEEVSENGLTSGQVRVLFKDSEGNLWVGTKYGLNFLSAKNLAFQNFDFKSYFYDPKKRSGEDIHTIYQDSRKRIWVGTKESGLNHFDPELDKFINSPLSKDHTSGRNVVHGVLEDDRGLLWISTNMGIVKFNPDDGTIKSFEESDGLVSNEFNINAALKARDGTMYFGSLEGLTRFHPERIITNDYAPPVILTGFRLFGEPLRPQGEDGILEKTITYTDEVSLNYDQAIFSVEFSIPNFINPEKNQYAYRLKGLEEKWNYSDNNRATYTIQDPGTYLFEVKGANNDGVWNPEPATLKIIVNPAPWRTWWAFLIYGFIISIALYLLINVVLSRSKLRHDLELEHLNTQKQESLNQAKLQFFTNVSHEFRTPLTLILGPLEDILRNYKGSSVLYKQLLSIEKNAGRLLSLVDQLMDFRKLENNYLQLKVTEGDIVVFTEEIFSSFRQYAQLHHFDYEFVSENDGLCVWYDRNKLERVVFNLISNAFKYTSDGGSIKVTVRQESGKAEIEIKDSGVGIAPEHLEKIFERFYEVGHSSNLLRTKYNKGTGIGLALAKGIIDLHSGELKVESAENKGSTFTMSLPLGKNHLKEDQIEKADREGEEHERPDVSGYLPGSPDLSLPEEAEKDAPSILVVEDNDDVRNYIIQIFGGEYKMTEARNGKEGLEIAARQVPDMIISDVMMPESDGIEFCSRIKTDIRTSHIPFILLTAKTSPDFKLEGLEMGADDYIHKPFHVKELRLKVRNLIQSRKDLREKFSDRSEVKPAEITISSLDEKLMEKALRIAEQNISNELFEVSVFCEELGISRTMLFTKIKAWTNLTPNEFMTVMRMKRAAQLLEQNKLTISQVCFEVGFKNPKYFSKCFQRHFSVTPTAYAKKFSSPNEEVNA